MLLLEPAHHGGEDACADALVGADAEHPCLAGAQRGHVRPSGVQPRHDRLGVAEQQLAGLGQRHRPRAARPLEQTLPDRAFERGDLLAHRRLRIAQLGGGAPERALVGDRLEGRQMAQFDAEPTIRLSDGLHENLDLS